MTPDPSSGPPDGAPPAPPPPPNFVKTARAIGWSFIGIRRSKGQEEDARLNPVHVIIGALLAALLFIALLVVLVHWIISSGVAK